jgi:Protein of unknown function (DUF2637)
MKRKGDGSPATSAPRVVGWLALAGVSLIAGIASYFHALAVVQASGATPPVAYLVPALADLVILGASADLLAASRAGHARPKLTMLALAVGVVVTLAMNVAAGWHHGLGGRLVAGWPALAFVLALESLAGLVRRGRGGVSLSPAPATCGHQPPLSLDAAIKEAAAHLSKRQISAVFEVSRARVDKVLPPAPNVAGADVPPSAPATLNGQAQ